MNNSQLALFDTAFHALSVLNSNVRSANPNLVQNDSSFEIFRDFATISFDAGQRTGKSVWVASRATKQDAVVVASEPQRDFYPAIAGQLYDLAYLRKYPNGDFKKYRYIFVEQAAWMEKKDIALVYQMFGTSKNTFVFLG